MQTVTTIGFDIAKSVFQVHGVDAAGEVVIRRQLKRRSVLDPFRTWGIAGRRPTIVLYEHSISPSRRVHLGQRASRAATGGYSGRGCRGLLPVNRDRRRRHTGATESS